MSFRAEMLTERCPNIIIIDISSNETINDSTLVLLSKAYRNLKQLSIFAGPLISDISIITLSEYCPSLESLDIRMMNSLITDTGILAISNGCSNLRNVSFNSIGYVQNMTDISLTALFSRNKHLQSVRVNGFRQIGDSSIIAL